MTLPKFRPDPPMLPFDCEQNILIQWATGGHDGFYSFADHEHQKFCNERYAVILRHGLPHPTEGSGPLKEICDRIHRELCKLRQLPPNLVNGPPERN